MARPDDTNSGSNERAPFRVEHESAATPAPQAAHPRGRELEAADALSTIFRVCLIGGADTSEPWTTFIDERFRQFIEILNDPHFFSDEVFFSAEHDTTRAARIAVFCLDVWEHLIYLHTFQGLDLGSLLQSVMHARLITGILREQFEYIHSFIVLRDVEKDTVIFPLQQHVRNAPHFPSGSWVFRNTQEDRLDPAAFIDALLQYARRLRGGPMRDAFRSALTALVTGGKQTVPPFALSKEQTSDLATFFTCLTDSLLRTWLWREPSAPSRMATELADSLPDTIQTIMGRHQSQKAGWDWPIRHCSDWFARTGQLRHLPHETLKQGDLEQSLRKNIFRLFTLAVFERACFSGIDRDKMKQLIARVRDDRRNTDLHMRDGLTYYDPGQLAYQALYPPSLETDQEGDVRKAALQTGAVWETTGAADARSFSPGSETRVQRLIDLALDRPDRARSLAAWLWYKIRINQNIQPKDLSCGLGALASACIALDFGASPTSALTALDGIHRWEAAMQDSPWSRHHFSREIAKVYEPLLREEAPIGFYLAVHNTGPVGQVGAEQPDVESYRIDIVRESPGHAWDWDKVRNAIRQTLRLDVLFAQAEMLAVDQERQQMRRKIDYAHRKAMRGYTGGLAHELNYVLDFLDRGALFTDRLKDRLLDCARQPRFRNMRIPELRDAGGLSDSEFGLILAELSHYVGGLVEVGFDLQAWCDSVTLCRDAVTFEDLKVITGGFEAASRIGRAIIQTTLDTARGKPERVLNSANAWVPLRCTPKKVLDAFTQDEQRKQRACPVSWNLHKTLASECYLPVCSFRFLILPELMRNAHKHASKEIQVSAKLQEDPLNSEPVFLLEIRNDVGQLNAPGYGAGQDFIADVLRSNLGLKDDLVDRFFSHTSNELSSSADGTYKVLLTFPTARYLHACQQGQQREIQ